jgi:hypothetical protein
LTPPQMAGFLFGQASYAGPQGKKRPTASFCPLFAPTLGAN